ncbi:TonB-dependent receptor [Hwangdonia lutea]|uniref:TonB-dependent receptor n=1 Tax=Hwangdonia lutea TaxID=3075823 RepID=A0AA97EMI4_9FLAO|nr:TonB-dependent receptor [Hwangdonia sp. SCSIO 19198]WOD44129.1 TonB-dependent receptor [Hwangdonia sp. SCSIO 19198]
MRHIILFLVLSNTFLSFSQSKPFNISGTVIDEFNKSQLESATVYLQRVKDSALVTYTISDKNGEFTLEGKTYDEKLNLLVSYVGYKTINKSININKEDIKLGTINMMVDDNALDEVIVKSTPPITIKKDTLEFNVKSFKTKKDANVEDLLKKLPGVEIDEAGKITVNGKEVNKILVNGKPFFGNDPTITTRNLTKEIIEKVQITDTKSKADAFAGKESDGENKTINLTIKKENNKGVFGRLAAGAGTDERYEFAGMFNYFDNDRRISLLSGGNNINSAGFSFGEIRKMFGGGNRINISGDGSFAIDGRSFGGGQGITTSRTSGLNYADKIGEKTDVSGSYFYSGSESENTSSTQRENILPDTRYFTDSNSSSSNSTDSHRANTELEFKIDSTLYINVKPSFNFTKSENISSRDETSRDIDRVLINESESSSFVENTAKNFSNNVNLTKRFGSKGSFLRLYFNNRNNITETDDFLDSETNIYGATPNDIIRKQFTDGENHSSNVSTGITYRQPILGKKLALDFSYRYNRNKQENIRSTFDFDEVEQDYNTFNKDLSTNFKYIDDNNTFGLELSYRKDKLFAEIETDYVLRTLENQDFLRSDLDLKRDFNNLQLSSTIRYRFSPKASFRAGYRLRNSVPSLRQLQPFQDVSNPLNTVVGNPNLKTGIDHRFNVNFNAFDFNKGTGFYGYVRGNFRNNQVVSKSIINEDLVRNTTFENVNGNHNINSSIWYNKKVKIDSLTSIKFGFGSSIGLSKNINFNNGVKYSSRVNNIGPSVNFELTVKDLLEIRPRYRLQFTKNRYDIDAFNDRSFVYHNLNVVTGFFLPKNFEWRNNVNFNYNPNIADGFQKSAWFWNSTLAYSFMKDSATLTLKAYDLLNQNTNARRIATENYIQDSQSTVLQQYFMLSFSWKFNSLGKKGEVRESRFHF